MQRKSRPRDPESSNAGVRGTYAVGDERRLRILETATEHFAQWGFHASSLARIASDVGITQSGLLHHFRSKEDLLVSVLKHSEEQDVKKFFPDDAPSVSDGFLRVLTLAEYNRQRPGRTKMFNVLAGESQNPGHPAHAFFLRRYHTITERLADMLRRGIDNGEVDPGTDCAAEAQQLTAVMDGLQLQWALAPQSLDMVGQLRRYLDRLYRSISVEGRGLLTRTHAGAHHESDDAPE